MDINTTKKLNNGIEIPILGIGVFKSGEDTYYAVRYALDAGYRHIDTAAYYNNEKAVGKAIRDSGISRENIFVTTKLWNDDMRSHKVKEAFEKSLSLLDLDYIDLYLIHWPVKEEYVNSYKAMENLYVDGKIKAIGVSNFQPHHLDFLLNHTEVRPAINQIECHPYLNNREVIEYCRSKNISPQSWSPLARGRVLDNNKLIEIASKHNKTIAQITIKWHMQNDIIVIPKSVHKQRIIENSQVFDFSLSPQDIQIIDNLDCGMRTGSHPDFFNF